MSMDEQALIARLGDLRAPDLEPSRERAVEAVPARLRAASARRPARARGARWGRLTLALGAAAVAAVAIVLIASLGGAGPDRSPAPYGAKLVRFAQASPLLLLEEPGWRVGDVEEETGDEGQMEFISGRKLPPEQIVERVGKDGSTVVSGQRPPAVRQRRADLNWRAGSIGSWLTDRAASADYRTTAPVLGTTAHVFRYEGGHPGDYEFTALWSEGGRVLEFRAPVPDLASFERHLAALHQVRTGPWLDALPADVVKAADRGHAVADMLRGVPLPAGFKPSQIPDAGLTTDRYQVGADVAGAVACRWFAQWGEDLRRGDASGIAEAERALAGAKRWPVLREMEAEGAYPQLLEEYAAAMPRREWFGRPLLPNVDSGLGCAEKGVRLPTGRSGGVDPEAR
jgi:hypothetical protein